jgi:hypothetical protein
MSQQKNGVEAARCGWFVFPTTFLGDFGLDLPRDSGKLTEKNTVSEERKAKKRFFM